jgi:hypothetical protein
MDNWIYLGICTSPHPLRQSIPTEVQTAWYIRAAVACSREGMLVIVIFAYSVFTFNCIIFRY